MYQIALKILLKALPYIIIVVMGVVGYFWINKLNSDIDKVQLENKITQAENEGLREAIIAYDLSNEISEKYNEIIIEKHHYHEKQVIVNNKTIKQVFENSDVVCEGISDEQVQVLYDLFNSHFERLK